ncbi:MAG: iron-sulfur protein [Peptococcaceae bacterium BICA1-8]|nr:MAG: iron-sulfur protein [Peptococcaceae bacterium BICA1-8]
MSKVALLNCSDYKLEEVEAQLDRGLALLGGWEQFIKPGDKVFLKLNLLMKKMPEEAVTTHPVVVEAVTRRLLALGASVVIGDSPGGPFSVMILKGIYKATGIEEVAQKTGAELNYNTQGVDVSFPQGKLIKKFHLCRAMVEGVRIVSLSKLKTHQMTKFTGAVKVLFGAVPGLQKAEYHVKMPKTTDFCDMLIDLALCVNPVLHIMDAIEGMEGHGPSAGNPRKVDRILISENPFALDWAALEVIGIKPNTVPTVSRAINWNIYSGPSKGDFLGDPIQTISPPFKVPEVSGEVRFPVPRFISEYLRPRPIFSPEICIGCGECARHCPPKALIIEDKFPKLNLEECIRCFCCQELCPHKAVQVKRSVLGKLLSR